MTDPTDTNEKPSIFSPTFNVQLPSQAADHDRPTFTFRKATVREILELDEAVENVSGSQADIVKAFKPYIEAQLVDAYHMENRPLDTPEDEILKLDYNQFVELFWLMKNGQDLTFDEKKGSGSGSPSDTENSDPTKKQ